MPAQLAAPARDLLLQRQLGLWQEDGELVRLPDRLALSAPEEVAAAVGPTTRAVLVGSAVTPRLLLALEGKARLVIARDPTHALVEAAPLHRFRARGGVLEVGFPVRLPAVIANPFSPYGWRFDPEVFLQLLSQAVRPLPVIDLVLGRAAQC